MPVYNVEKYLRECVDSILNQTFTDFELILVDDGSPDNCPQLCDAYAEQDSRVRVIHKKNGGVSSARNAGLNAARGEWIGFVDPDDYILPEFYQKLLDAARRENAMCAMCSTQNIDEDGKKIERIDLDVQKKVIEQRWILEDVGKDISFIVLWNKIYRAECWDNIRFPEGEIHEDTYVFAELFAQIGKVVGISERLYYYRMRSESIMTTQKTLDNLSESRAFYHCFWYFENHNMLDLLAPTEKQIFGKLTNVYYALPKKARRDPRTKDAKKMQMDAVKILYQYHLLSKRTLCRTLIFQFFPDVYGVCRTWKR